MVLLHCVDPWRALSDDIESDDREQLDGVPFNLTELVPDVGKQPGVTLTREEFSLPETGTLTLTFKMVRKDIPPSNASPV